jgi:hypothetical protein
MGFVAAGAPSELANRPLPQLPLDFLLEVMADESHPIATRLDAAKAAAPYVHFRKGLIDTSGRDVPIVVQVLRFADVESELETPTEPAPITIEHKPPPASH